jgi:hypothetical protein
MPNFVAIDKSFRNNLNSASLSYIRQSKVPKCCIAGNKYFSKFLVNSHPANLSGKI